LLLIESINVPSCSLCTYRRMQLTAVMAIDGYLRCSSGRGSYIYPTQHKVNVNLISGYYHGYALDV
jgi:hypothetical protein